MSYTGFNIEVVDTFKKYKGYEGCYIIDYYIRDKYHDSLYGSYNNWVDAFSIMNELELWDDYMIGYVTADGYASFNIDL